MRLNPIWKRSTIVALNGINTFYFYLLFVNAFSTAVSSYLVFPSIGIGIGVDSTFLYSILRSDSNER